MFPVCIMTRGAVGARVWEVCVCRCDGDVICVDHDMNRCAGWWYVCSVNVK